MEPEPSQRAAIMGDERSLTLAARLGSWAALLAAVLTVCFVVLTVLFPADGWRDIDAYAGSFETIDVLQLVPVLLLAPVVVILMASIHSLVSRSRQVLSHLALTFAAIYGTIITINYVLQLFVVRLNVQSGDLDGLRLLAMPNPRSIFTGLEIAGYGFFGVMSLFAGAAFAGVGLERWVRRLFLATGVSGLTGAVGGLADLRVVMLTGFGLSLMAFLATAVLLAVHLRRPRRIVSDRPATLAASVPSSRAKASS
jgi:hypothetical protein